MTDGSTDGQDFGFCSQTTEFNFWFGNRTIGINFGCGSQAREYEFWFGNRATVLNIRLCS